MKWFKVLDNWEKGLYLKNYKSPFMWMTNALTKENNNYKDIFLECKSLENIKQDHKPFDDYLNTLKCTEGDVISFLNISKDTLLIVPIPRKGKNFSSYFYFFKNSSKRQKINVFKKVSEMAKLMLEDNEKIYISIHGLGVHYLHIRISPNPKYYPDFVKKKFSI